MKKTCRATIYILGLFSLALGIVLNTKANLGVSPIISVPYGISAIWNVNLGGATAAIYTLYVFGQILLLGRDFSPIQLLQIPLSVIFGMVINFFSAFIIVNSNSLVFNLFILMLGIIFTGIGASFTLLMNIIPNAADGFVQAASKRTGQKLGTVKNILDASSVLVTILIGLVFHGKIVGIGIGTVIAVIFVGRVIAIINTLFRGRLTALTE
jgi:uncharacterized membrane protein YczE